MHSPVRTGGGPPAALRVGLRLLGLTASLQRCRLHLRSGNGRPPPTRRGRTQSGASERSPTTTATSASANPFRLCALSRLSCQMKTGEAKHATLHANSRAIHAALQALVSAPIDALNPRPQTPARALSLCAVIECRDQAYCPSTPVVWHNATRAQSNGTAHRCYRSGRHGRARLASAGERVLDIHRICRRSAIADLPHSTGNVCWYSRSVCLLWRKQTDLRLFARLRLSLSCITHPHVYE